MRRESGERGSARLKRIGRRFARWPDALEDKRQRRGRRLGQRNKSVRRQDENRKCNRAVSLRLRGESQRVVRRRMRNVFVRVVVFRRMIVVMEDQFGQ